MAKKRRKRRCDWPDIAKLEAENAAEDREEIVRMFEEFSGKSLELPIPEDRYFDIPDVDGGCNPWDIYQGLSVMPSERFYGRL